MNEFVKCFSGKLMIPFRELELEGNGFHQLHKGKDSLLDIIKAHQQVYMRSGAVVSEST